MYFIDIEWPVTPRRGASLFQPPLVIEPIRAGRHNHRVLIRPMRKRSRIRVRLDDQPSGFSVGNFEFVVCARTDVGNKQFPDPASVRLDHGMASSIPTIKITNNADVIRAGRPRSKAHAGPPVNSETMGAELVVHVKQLARVEQPKVALAQHSG